MTKKTEPKKTARKLKPVPANPAQPVHDSIYEREHAFQTHYRHEQQLAGRYWLY